ncbi:MAG: putative rane protein, partial [Gemmatimonadetes bacterium]|nr:putative rane protein [Gemmatimonadota bacterium]
LGSGQLLACAIVLAVLVLAGSHLAPARDARARPGAPAPAASEPASDPGRGWAWLFVALAVPLLGAVWLNGVSDVRGFDSQADHLPRAARWLSLGRITDESGELLTPYYPGNFLVLVRWMLALGTDAYSFVPSLAASVTCIWALYRICREMGQPRWTALVSALCAISCSLVPFLSTTAQSDVAVPACLLVAVVILLRWVPTTERRRGWTPDRRELGMRLSLGAALGLAVGTKYSAIPMAVAVTLVAAYYAWRASRELDARGVVLYNARTIVVTLASILVPAAVTSGYWLLRNLVVHGNPLYPVAAAGLPGVDVRVIIPVKPSLVDSLWNRITFPWVQWDFRYVYDDGLGVTFACVALVGLLVTPLFRGVRPDRFRLVWLLTVAAYAIWLGTGSITVRFGLFPILLTFCFVGELWRRHGTVLLKLVTVATFAISVLMPAQSLVVGAVYRALLPAQPSVIAGVVDTLPPSRILNAAAAAHRYRLLGRDYRHEVITHFRTPQPADVARSRARYVLLAGEQLPAFRAASRLRLVAEEARGAGERLSLWEVVATPPAGDGRVR